MAFLSVAVLFLSASALPGASGDPQDPPLPRPPVQARQELVAVDGKPAAPGRIPDGTSDAARAAFSLMLSATRSKDTEPAPLRAFDMTFKARLRDAAGGATNDVDARFEYLDEAAGYVSGTYETSGQRSFRGPAGDYLTTREGTEWTTKRLEGREDKQSREELDRWLAISRNFVALTRPDGIRIIDLQALELVPAPTENVDPLTRRTLEFTNGRFVRLPFETSYMDFEKDDVHLLRRARELTWLEVASPDFQLYVSSAARTGGTPIYRALFGLDPKTGRAEQVQVFEESPGGATRWGTALFVRIARWITLGDSGFVLPQALEVYGVVDDPNGPLHFSSAPGTTLWMYPARARINPPDLVATRFAPN